MKKAFTLFAVLLSLNNSINACTCINSIKTFAKNISVTHVILMGEVIAQIPTPKGDYSCSGLTQIKVLHWYQNQLESDTIYYCAGSLCSMSLERWDIGDTLIVKAEKWQIPAYYGYPSISEQDSIELQAFGDKYYQHLPIIGYYLCDWSTLNVENNQVVGDITKCFGCNRWNFIEFVSKINEKWGKKLKGKYHQKGPRPQIWSPERFSKLMRRRWNSLY